MALTYNSLFLVTVVALISPILSVRVFRGLIPAVVIEILFGILVGPSGLHIVTSTKYVDFMANFGFSYLMFLSGLELDFGLIFEKTQTQRISPWVRAILFFLSTFAVSAGIAALLFALHWILHPFIVALVLSTTSTGILTPALKESAWIADVFGQELLAAGLVADMLTLMAITGYVAFHTSGNAFSILLVMVLLLMFVILYRLFRLFAHVRGLQTVENATSEMGLRWAFALILSFLAFSETLGTEVVVGAFLAGAIVSLLAERHSPLTQKLNSIGYGFLLPIFFVNVGLKFSVHSLAAETNFWLMLAVMLVGMYLNKTLPALVFMRRFPVQQRFAGGVLLSARLSLIIAASQIGSQIGVLT